MPGVVLLVEDEPLLARNVRTFLERKGYRVEIADCVAAARRLYGELQPDAMLIDHNLPDGTGLSLIGEIRKQDRWTKLVMITAYGGIDVAVSAMKYGADDYLTKPVSLDEISILVGKLLSQTTLENSLSYFQAREKRDSGLEKILGKSPAIVELKQRLKSLAAAERSAEPGNALPGPPVLILGETGTGKELVARAVHFDGPRRDKPFVSINCAALPEQLVESELFGHERGAFTGAGDKKIGLFQAAEGGTLFLDEIGELPLPQQAKLLRAIEDKVVRPVGSVRDRPVDVRFVAATNSVLEEQARHGDFRGDLFYRLNTITLNVPPLRERGEDIVLLAENFVKEFQRRYARSRLSLTASAHAALLRHAWPGNVRELRNVIEQACLMCARDAIEDTDLNLRELPSLVPVQSRKASEDQSTLVETERSLIIEALRQNNGNVTLAARKLGVSRDTLRYRMEKHALRRDHYV